MAEMSYFWDNPGTGDSPAAPGYDSADLMDAFYRVITGSVANLGVLLGYENELEVTDGGGLNAAVATGGAMAAGLFYDSDAAETVALPNNSTVHVVARRSWAAQTVRLAQVAALVQVDGVTWDIPLAEVTTVAGAITLITDEREYCVFSTNPLTGNLDPAAIQADALTPAKLENQDRRFLAGSGDITPDVANPTVWSSGGASPERNYWTTGAALQGWMEFLAPADMANTNLNVYVWFENAWSGAIQTAQYTWDAWVAPSGNVLAQQTGNNTFNVDGRTGQFHVPRRELITTLTVNPGDLCKVKLWKSGGTFVDTIFLIGYEFEWESDS